jgi:hypothetical protein
MEITIAIALTVGLTEVLKRSFNIKARYAPALSLIIGVGIIFLGDSPVSESIIAGIIVGLSASGLYSGTKATLQKE